MVCKKCGTELPNDASVCTSCGEPQNKDVFSVESQWVKERNDREGRQGKKIISLCAMFLCVVFLAASYLVNIIPYRRAYDEELPPYAAVVGTDGNISIISTNNKKVIKLSEGSDVRNLMLNEKEDTLFFIVTQDGKTTLCSRYISNLIYESNIVARDVESYLINNTAKLVAYKTTDGKLMWGDTDNNVDHVEVSDTVDDYYLSYNGKLLVYTLTLDGIPYIYVFDGEKSELVCKDAELIDLKQDLRRIYYKYGGGLFIYNTQNGDKLCLAASCTEVLRIYNKENLVYYTVTNRETGTMSLMSTRRGDTELISANFASLEVAHSEEPFLIYSEFDGTQKVYRAVTDGTVRSVLTFSGSTLSDFTIEESGNAVFYLDKSGEQVRMIRAEIGSGSLDKLAVIDTDVKLICGIIDRKPLYIKDFNPLSMSVSLYFGGDKIADKISVREAVDLDTHILAPRTFDYNDGEKTSAYLAAIPLRSSDSYMFYDSDGFISKFDGERVSRITEAEAQDLYLISDDCILYSTGSGFFISQNDKNTEVDMDVSDFMFIEPYGNKPYQLSDN